MKHAPVITDGKPQQEPLAERMNRARAELAEAPGLLNGLEDELLDEAACRRLARARQVIERALLTLGAA